MNTDARLTAKLLSACPPDSAQKEKLEDVLSKKYGKAVELVWQEDRTAQGGFRIELGSEVIDWTAEGRLEQLKERLTGLKSEGSVIPLIRDAVKSWVPEVCAREVGSVLTVADGIAYVEGLEGATYGEILLFEGGIRGMVQELRSGRIGCILFGRGGGQRGHGGVPHRQDRRYRRVRRYDRPRGGRPGRAHRRRRRHPGGRIPHDREPGTRHY